MPAILAAILDFFKNFVFRKTATNFTGISRKHVFLASNMKIIENRIKKKNLEQIVPKFYNFLFWTLICIINYAYIIGNVKGCAHYQTTGTENFILIAWTLLILGPKNLCGGPFDPTPPLGRSRVN